LNVTSLREGGFSTLYTDSTGSRHLSYHNIPLPDLQERAEYEYRVRVADDGEWSEWKGFTSLYSEGVTRIAMFGDMGMFVEQTQMADEGGVFYPGEVSQRGATSDATSSPIL